MLLLLLSLVFSLALDIWVWKFVCYALFLIMNKYPISPWPYSSAVQKLFIHLIQCSRCTRLVMMLYGVYMPDNRWKCMSVLLLLLLLFLLRFSFVVNVYLIRYSPVAQVKSLPLTSRCVCARARVFFLHPILYNGKRCKSWKLPQHINHQSIIANTHALIQHCQCDTTIGHNGTNENQHLSIILLTHLSMPLYIAISI